MRRSSGVAMSSSPWKWLWNGNEDVATLLPAGVAKSARAWRGVAAVVGCWMATVSGVCAPVVDVPVSFRNDIVPILSKANCNGGGCHGAMAGQGGFRLSLFGYNPEADHLSITREAQGRRVEISDPGLSLLLTKPTTMVRHKGGKRLEAGSEDYQTLARWIAQGAPGPRSDDVRLTSLTVTPGERAVRVVPQRR